MFDEETELDFVIWFQGRGGWLDTPMGLFSQLGHPLVLVVILAVIFWCIDSGLGQRMALFVFFAGSANEILKRIFGAPRAFWVSNEVRAIGEGSTAFGMPSGHSVVAPMWLLIALVSKRRWVWVVTGSVAVMIGVSRIYLGAHFPSQVAFGWIVGGLLLIGFRTFEAPFLSWFTPKPTVQQLLVVAAVTIGLIGAGALSAAALDDFTPELSWERNAEGQIDETEPFDPVDTNDIAATGGIFAGTATGLVLLAGRGGFQSSGPLKRRLLRFAVG